MKQRVESNRLFSQLIQGPTSPTITLQSHAVDGDALKQDDA